MRNKLLRDAKIYTVAKRGWSKHPATAMAISGNGRILVVGTEEEARAAAGENAEVIALGGKAVLPGLIDSHVHIPGNSITRMFEIYLYSARDLAETLRTVEAFVREHPDRELYVGDGYIQGIGTDPRGPRREWLDAIVPNKPVVLHSTDGHNLWLNSKAFEVCGITPNTPVPKGGSIPVDETTGELWGVMTDAFQLLTIKPAYTKAQQRKAFQDFQQNMLGWGYTAAMFIAPHFTDDDIPALEEGEGALLLYAGMSTNADPSGTFEDVETRMETIAALYQDSTRVQNRTVKYFADGVVEGMTAYLEEPYAPGICADPKYCSEPIWSHEKLTDHFRRTIEKGWQIHVHTVGDAATRMTLDALERAYAASGVVSELRTADDGTVNPVRRDVLTHLQLIREEDLDRMKSLGIVASFQPFWHCKEPGWYEVLDGPILGEARAFSCYPVGSCVRRGIPVAFSGDYPVVPDNDPFMAIEIAVTRNLSRPAAYGAPEIDGPDDPQWQRDPRQRIGIEEAIEAYTKNAAYSLFREEEIGTLERGKCADFVVLDCDPVTASPIDIDKTRVLETWIGGECVWER